MKKLTYTIAGIQGLAALAIVGAIKLWAPVCQKMLALQNGNETHMKCFFTGQAAIALAAVLLALAVVTFFAKTDHKKVQFAALVTSVMIFLVFTSLIGICMKTDMACHTTAAWCKPAAIIAAICALIDMLGGKAGQLPS